MNDMAQIDFEKLEQKMLIPTYKSADKRLIKRCKKVLDEMYGVNGKYPGEIVRRLGYVLFSAVSTP